MSHHPIWSDCRSSHGDAGSLTVFPSQKAFDQIKGFLSLSRFLNEFHPQSVNSASMHTGKSYSLKEFLYWTRRKITWLVIISSVPTILYLLPGLHWLTIPWSIAGLLGAATAFIVGFKNTQTYNRTWEARQVWGAAVSASRAWCMMCRDYIPDKMRSRGLAYLHLGWITAMRYQLRTPRPWESLSRKHNQEYLKYYSIPEHQVSLKNALEQYLDADELSSVLSKKNTATQILGLEGRELENLYQEEIIDNFRFMEMHNMLRSFNSHQGKNERIKNFPYPRQYATVSNLFVKLFCLLLPFALLQQFSEFSQQVLGKGNDSMVWLVIPFSVLLSWIFTSLEQVGESTENPFEGGANDVPISQMSRVLEIDILEMLGENDLPEMVREQHNIIL